MNSQNSYYCLQILKTSKMLHKFTSSNSVSQCLPTYMYMYSYQYVTQDISCGDLPTSCTVSMVTTILGQPSVLHAWLQSTKSELVSNKRALFVTLVDHACIILSCYLINSVFCFYACTSLYTIYTTTRYPLFCECACMPQIQQSWSGVAGGARPGPPACCNTRNGEGVNRNRNYLAIEYFSIDNV